MNFAALVNWIMVKTLYDYYHQKLLMERFHHPKLKDESFQWNLKFAVSMMAIFAQFEFCSLLGFF